MSIDMSQFLETFFEESFEGLEVMEVELLNLSLDDPDAESINTIFRAAHSIKGGSGTFGLNDVASFTHVIETLLDEIREGKRSISKETVDLFLESVDVLRDLLSALRNHDDIDRNRVVEVQNKLNQALGAQGYSSQDVSVENAAGGVFGWTIFFTPDANMLKTGNDPVKMLTWLEELSDDYRVELDTSYLPEIEKIDGETSYLSWTIHLWGDIEREKVTEVFEWVEDECKLQIVPLQDMTQDADLLQSADTEQNLPKTSDKNTSKARSTSAARSGSADTGSIRVSINKVDELINMVGELVITQSMLSQLGEDDEFSMEHIERLRDGLAQLERNTRELQENVMRIRMLPISFVFQRFPRLVRDLSSKLGKKVELQLLGEQTELDKTVMEKIGDPLVHLVRNSLDHGVESPEKRIQAGKPDTGKVTLNAYHEGGNIIIEISDDGAGLNREKILQKAIKNGIVHQTDSLSDEEIHDLIFSPGFSTAEVVSDVSGRGVGMDVVRKNIRSLGGSVEVKTRPGLGTTFTIRLPLTLAILDGQTVKVGDEMYIVPLVSIIESIQVNPVCINRVAGQADLYKLRDEYIPVVRLAEIFSVATGSRSLQDGLLVVVEAEGRKIAVFVDDLLGQQQVVIKSLETNFRRVKGISGATILGDGTVALILDIAGLIRLSRDFQPVDGLENTQAA